jgi:uncharacterized membrane protein
MVIYKKNVFKYFFIMTFGIILYMNLCSIKFKSEPMIINEQIITNETSTTKLKSSIDDLYTFIY